MYKSPIQLIYQGMEYEIEKGILKAVRKQEIIVDKEELLRALKYDRGQYKIGYADGKADAVKQGHWIAGLDGSYMCSECGKVFRYEIGNYCTHCGAKMDGDEDD